MIEARPPAAIKARPARPRRRHKAEGQGWNPLLDYFSSTGASSTHGLLQELKNLQEDDRDILWYPSAGMDLTDIHEIGGGRLSFDKTTWEITPMIFVHTDPVEYFIHGNISESEELLFQNQWAAVLQKIPAEGKYCWVFKIKIDNYEFLPWLLTSGIRVPFLYTACDGVTSGMGGSLNKFPITTFYLTRFYKVLGVKYHITEYSREYYCENSHWVSENLQREVPRLEECYPELGKRASAFPACFINMKELPIRSFASAEGHPLVVRYSAMPVVGRELI